MMCDKPCSEYQSPIGVVKEQRRRHLRLRRRTAFEEYYPPLSGMRLGEENPQTHSEGVAERTRIGYRRTDVAGRDDQWL